ncbi:uncharacterized protein LOC104584320 [Brachypodium distachyon]|uniref:uncharacterized protein LOC104584320 n=1 Tax=Brachypodium distachyon TaxID=15368 RepID=UPI00053004B2|nr:uncharacterized protein LOC104584320 [Brachypodium distachyon]|eukprot:XP_010236902.1 uncharacterized protein LOC104584320 [Brachypodium distachyon]
MAQRPPSSPPDTAAALAQLLERYPISAVNASLTFLNDVKARCASTPSVRDELLALLKDFKDLEIVAAQAAARPAFLARVQALLGGQPDLFASFESLFRNPPAAREAPPRRRSSRPERRRTTAVAVDPEQARALAFLERLKRADARLYREFIVLLKEVDEVPTLDAHEIYGQAVAVFCARDRGGEFHRGFAEFLPTERDLPGYRVKREPEYSQPRRAPKRKAAAVVEASAKKPRADEPRNNANNRRASASPVNDGGEKTKKALTPFREACLFEARYTRLARTMARIKVLLEREALELPTPEHPRHDINALFPDRECREALQEMYHGAYWAPMQDALENKARTGPALLRILRRLMEKERVAVRVAMERRDPERVRGRMAKLAPERVRCIREKREQAAEHRSAGDRGDPCALGSS